jgi:type IV pilus assembly protein PilZ
MAKTSVQEAVSPQFIEGIERRDSPRADLVVRVNYQTVDALFSEFARNINEGGIFLETEAPQPLGSTVELEFKLPGSEAPVEVAGLVVRVEPGGMGIEFDELGPEHRRRINQIVRNLRPGD